MSDDIKAKSSPRYPEVVCKLVGENGNAFNLLAIVGSGLYRAGVPQEDRDRFTREATSGNYDHLLATCMKWVTVT